LYVRGHYCFHIRCPNFQRQSKRKSTYQIHICHKCIGTDHKSRIESIIYDTGFPLATKYALCAFIAQRKDTFVVLSTHDVYDSILTASEEHSLAIALRTRLQMYPESDYFGTPVMRGMIVGRSARLRNSQYTKHLPLSAEIAIKSARYMGAGIGRWKNGSHFDGAPGSVVDFMYDINITWVPTAVRNRNWDVGLNWVQSYDRRSYFFPALKTVYDNDTSVLNSYFTAEQLAAINNVPLKRIKKRIAKGMPIDRVVLENP